VWSAWARTRAQDGGARARPPAGLILADIQLGEGSSSLDAVNDLLDTFEVPVIFITAYPEHFLRRAPRAGIYGVEALPTGHGFRLLSQALFFRRNAVQRKRRG